MTEGALVVVIPVYSLGASIRPTLNSIETSVRAWTRDSYSVFLSDSSVTDQSVQEATIWAEEVQCSLVVDHSDDRRIKKIALNKAFASSVVANADVVIVCDDDIIVERESISALIKALKEHPEAIAAVGVTRADPKYSRGLRAGGAWDLDVNSRIARRLPTVFVRSEGALWAATGSFCSSYQFPTDDGSVVEDQVLANYIVAHDLVSLNVPDAVAYKIPPRGFKDFANQSRRTRSALQSAITPRTPNSVRVRSVIAPTLRNPFGAILYGVFWSVLLFDSWRAVEKTNQYWTRSPSTARHAGDQ
jgi:cellulose synthase/poly-beta-1,6-N-acetylglucosamine synthase-like glycosyltransferase